MLLRRIQFSFIFLAVGVLSPLWGDLDALLDFEPSNNGRFTSSHSSGNNSTHLTDASAHIDANSLLESLSDELVMLMKPKGRFELRFLQNWRPLKLSIDSWRVKLTEYPGQALEQRFMIGFQIFSGGKTLGNWRLPVEAKLWQRGWVSSRELNAGSALRKSDFKLQEMDVLRFRKSIVPEHESIQNFQTRRSIKANQPLYWRDVEARYIVRKGELVEILAQKGTLNITMKAKALEDGAIGDVVALRNVESNKRIEGEVIDEDTVRVYF